MKKIFKNVIYFFCSSFNLFLLILISLFFKCFKSLRKKNKIIFGTTPILNNKYWANALKKGGFKAETLMQIYYANINKKEDFDKYFDDIIPKFLRKKYINKVVHPLFVWLYIIRNAKIFIMPFHGVVFYKFFWKMEYLLFKLNDIKVIVLPYGSDAYMYSKIQDKSLQNALLVSYPDAAKNEKFIERKVFFWSKYADCVVTGFMGIDGMPRWDIPIHQFVQIDTDEWQQKTHYSMYDGNNGPVKIIHTPNHRGFKGTEFLIQAVESLKRKGLKVGLLLLENVPNDKVQQLMREADILAEQFICNGYALSAIEGMATGLPVLSNLSNKNYTEMFRRYSFLNECPILSTTPETIEENLELLIRNPKLRKELGVIGRKYVEKYHSYKTAQYLFANIFKKLEGEKIDLVDLFHPLKSDYVKKNYIFTPLVNNKYIRKNDI